LSHIPIIICPLFPPPPYYRLSNGDVKKRKNYHLRVYSLPCLPPAIPHKRTTEVFWYLGGVFCGSAQVSPPRLSPFLPSHSPQERDYDHVQTLTLIFFPPPVTFSFHCVPPFLLCFRIPPVFLSLFVFSHGIPFPFLLRVQPRSHPASINPHSVP